MNKRYSLIVQEPPRTEGPVSSLPSPYSTFYKVSEQDFTYLLLFLTVEDSFPGLQPGKLNSLARSNASLYGTKDDLYDRLKRHAYTGKKGVY